MPRRAILAALLTIPASVAGQAIPNDFLVTLERTSCFGECHAYTVSIDARGGVNYIGKDWVRVTGKATTRVPVSEVRALLATVERARFFQLRDRYRSIRNPDGSETVVTDLPTTFVTVTSGGRTKRVEDYVGAPQELRDLERQIDAVSGSRRWIRIDEPTLRQLVAEGRAPSAAERQDMLSKALQYDDLDVITTLLELGTDPNKPFGDARVLPITTVQSVAAVRALLAAGASPVARDSRGETALGRAVWLAPEVTEALLSAGVPADIQIDLDGQTALIAAAGVGNISVVKLLLAAGANPFYRGSRSTALEAARHGKELEERQKRFPDLETPRFQKDFDAVIAVLEQAMARKR